MKKKLEYYQSGREQLLRETDFLRFEIEEIENAGLKPGEEEELESAYRRFPIAEGLWKPVRAYQRSAGTPWRERFWLWRRQLSTMREFPASGISSTMWTR